MRDKNNQIQKELVSAVVGLDNLRNQVFLEYGEHFLEQFRADREEQRPFTAERQAGTVQPAIPPTSSRTERYQLRSQARGQNQNPGPEQEALPTSSGAGRYNLRSRERERGRACGRYIDVTAVNNPADYAEHIPRGLGHAEIE